MLKGGVGKAVLLLAFGLGFLTPYIPANAQATSSDSIPLEERSQYGTYDRALIKSVQRDSINGGSSVSQSVKYTIEFLSGKRKGQSFTFSKPQNDPDLQKINPQAGDRVVVFSQIDLSNQPKIYFENYDRYPIYFWIPVILLFALILLAGKVGLKIGLSLGLSVFIASYVLLHLGLRSWPAIAIVLISFGLIGACSLLLFTGWNKKSLASLLGMLLGMSITCAVVSLFAMWAHLQSPLNEINQNYLSGFNGLENIYLLGILLASFAIVQDICVSIVTGIAEIKRTHPTTERKQLFRSGMIIGRDHFSTMILILPLAAMGLFLPAIAVQISGEVDWIRLLNMDLISQLIILSAASILGVILTIPVCSLIGSLFWTRGPKPTSVRRALVWRAEPLLDDSNSDEMPKHDTFKDF